jgi:flagellar motor switch protein FliM
MEKILSQDEVDALLKGLSDGEIEGTKETSPVPDNVRMFDLTNQDRIVRGRMPTLDIINDRFAKIHRISLSGSLRRMVDINVCQAEMIKFGDPNAACSDEFAHHQDGAPERPCLVHDRKPSHLQPGGLLFRRHGQGQLQD